MKKYLLFLIVSLGMISCSNVPRKSVSEPLSDKEIANWLKEDTLFISEYYQDFREWWETLDQIERVKYSEITYKRLNDYIQYEYDTARWTPFENQSGEEWKKIYGPSIIKADSIINYWDSLNREHLTMMNQLVKVDLKKIDTEYYAYIGGVKNVDLGFLITPLQGTIQQLRFEYSYGAKINSKKSNFHSCICTSPISSPSIKWWEVAYSERERFGGETATSFLRDYDMDIKITSIRKDNINYNIDDIDIPKSVKSYLDSQKDEWSIKYMTNYYKKGVIVDLVKSDYLDEFDYFISKKNEELKKYDSLCFSLFSDFLEFHFHKRFN